MGDFLGVGGSAWAPLNGSWDFTPIVAAIAGLVLLKLTFGIRLSVPIMVAALVGGTAFSLVADAWGLPATSLVMVGSLLVLSVVQRRT